MGDLARDHENLIEMLQKSSLSKQQNRQELKDAVIGDPASLQAEIQRLANSYKHLSDQPRALSSFS